MNKKQTRIWVDPKFKKKLKYLATEEETSILEITKKLSRDSFDELEKAKHIKPKKISGGEKFDFKI
jgi:mRNA-degrading endonuclease RelE of RelBE toxin-antitoxin system